MLTSQFESMHSYSSNAALRVVQVTQIGSITEAIQVVWFIPPMSSFLCDPIPRMSLLQCNRR